ncbi:MAG: NAD(P)/FAD-dependent oxidoreductase [Bacteroidota bacterium]
MNSRIFDAAIIGGGFYGCSIAAHLARSGLSTLLIEREPDLMLRASANNQARVHMGYHYPRSFRTAFSSFTNFARFATTFKPAIVDDWTALYAVANSGSKVNAHRFFTTFNNMTAPVRVAAPKMRGLFNLDLIEEVFEVREFAFDCSLLRDILRRQLTEEEVDVRLQTSAGRVIQEGEDCRVELSDGSSILARQVYCCAYSGINDLLTLSGLPILSLKHEVTEMALCSVPDELSNIGVTVVDGPFFSLMPYPDRKLHSLSHVRYTPHASWRDDEVYANSYDIYNQLRAGKTASRFPYMLRASAPFMPALAGVRQEDSLFEVKTVLLNREDDDGRPILFKQNHGLANLHVILGGKIDNVFDLIEMLQTAARVSARQ